MSNNSRGRGGFGGRPRGGQRGGWRGATRGGGRAKELHEDLGRVNLNDQTTSGQGIVSKPTSGKETEYTYFGEQQIQTEGDVSLLLLLPPELLKLICEKCDEKGLLHLERTCRQLRALVRQCRAWQKHCVARNWQLYDYTLNQFANSSQGWSDRHKYGAVILEVEHSRVDDIPWVKFREPGLMPRLHITDKHLYVTHGREVRFTNQRPRPYIPFHALGPGGGGGRGRIGHGFWKGHLLKDLPNHFTEPYDDIADFCVDGDRLVTAGADSRLRLWSLKAKRVVRELIGHLGIVHTVGFVGDVAVSGSRDRTLRMWDLNAGGCKQVIEMQDRVWCVSVGKGLPHPGMALCGTSGHRGSPLLLMDLEACTALTHFKGHSGGVSSIRPIPHKSVFLSCGYDSACRLYDVRSPQWCAEFADIDGTPVTCVDTDNIGCVITLSCILRWSKVKKSCPLCHTQFHHVLSHFQLDGSFDGSVLTTNLVNLMSQVRWLDLEFIEPCDLEPPLMRYQPESIIVEEDAFGTYTLDQFDEDYDPHSFAPSRGKEGRLRKHHAGCVSLAGQGKSVGPNRNQPPRRNSYPQSSSPPGSSMDAQSSGQTPEKLGRRAKRALMRKQADERAAGGATVGN